MPNATFSRRFAAVVLPLMLAAAGCAHNPPARKINVAGQTLTSSIFPVGTLAFGPTFEYVGGTQFVLYGVADCEIHVFAQVKDRKVQRFYWVQFEGYLPSEPTRTYDYSRDPKDLLVGGQAFHTRGNFVSAEEGRKNLRPGSDREAVLRLFDQKGYVLDQDMMFVRLVRLDESRRRELLIVYSEPLAPLGLTAQALALGGPAHPRRDELLEGLKRRVADGMVMRMN